MQLWVQKNVKGKAKKVAKDMPKKDIKKYLKTEKFNDVVNCLLEKFFKEGMTLEKNITCEWAKEKNCDCDGCPECIKNQAA